MFKLHFFENEGLNEEILSHDLDLFSHVQQPSADRLLIRKVICAKPSSSAVDKFSNSISSRTKRRTKKSYLALSTCFFT